MPHVVVTGAAMDEVVAPAPGRARIRIAAAVVAALALAFAAWHWMPRGLRVNASDVRLATTENGTFNDAIIVRANVVPLNSVILDAVASGRVEEVPVRDGALVHRGDLLFRLSNPQSQLELLARQSDHATQISNLSNLRVELEASRADYDRRVRDAEFALTQARKAHDRAAELSGQGFVSAVALDDATVAMQKQERALREEKSSADSSLRVQQSAILQMERAIGSLESGLQLVQSSVDALAVRAAADGRLTDFHLQVGEIVKPDQHIGRIDDPARSKFSAQIDEYYRERVTVGLKGTAQVNGRGADVTVTRIDPQIKQGRFSVELEFAGADAPALEPGRSVDIQIAFGTSGAALLLPVAPYLNDSGGAWVYVVDAGHEAVKRAIRTGRRSAGQVEVLSGLAAGEQVVVSSYAPFNNAERLQIVP
jgi:HlyD family secretion protein